MFVHDDMVIDLKNKMANGWSPVEIAANWGISIRKFKEEVKAHPKLQEAVEIGLTAYEAWFRQVGKALVQGELRGKPDTWFKFMEKEFGWHDKTVTETKSELESLSYEELKAELERLEAHGKSSTAREESSAS